MNRFAFLAAYVLVISSCSRDYEGNYIGLDNYRYLSDDGRYTFSISSDLRIFRNHPSSEQMGPKTDVGGRIYNCSTAQFTCMAFEDIYVSRPPDGVGEWTVGPYIFRVSERTDGDEVFVVGTKGGVARIRYTYSREKGLIRFGLLGESVDGRPHYDYYQSSIKVLLLNSDRIANLPRVLY